MIDMVFCAGVIKILAMVHSDSTDEHTHILDEAIE